MSATTPDPAPDARPDDGADAPSGKRSKLKAALKWTGIVLGGLVGLVLLAVVLLLYTPLSAVAARYGLATYDDMIAGAVDYAAVEGSLAGGLTIRDLTLSGSAGHPLVQVERVHLRISPAQLLTGAAVVDVLAVEGARVDVPHTPPGAPGPFADLSPPPSPPQPEPPSTGIGPDLPLRIEAMLDVHRVTVRRQAADGAWQTAVDDAHVVVRAEAEGRTAHVEVDPQTRADVPTVPVEVGGVGVVLNWDAPTLRVEDLRVQTDLGVVAAPLLTVDAERMTVDGGLWVRGRHAPLVERFGLPLDHDPEVTLIADAAADELRLAAYIDPGQGPIGPDGELMPDALWLRLDVRGQVQPELDLRAEVLLEGLDPARQADGLPAGRLGAVIKASIQGTRPEDMVVQTALDCLGCRVDGVGPIDLALFAHLVRGTGSAALVLEAAGATVDAHAEVWDLESLRAHVGVEVPDAPRTLAAARAFAPDLPEIEGALDLSADCVGDLTDPACTVGTTVRDFAGQGASLARAEVVGVAWPTAGPYFAADVTARELAFEQDRFRRLEVQASGTPAALWLTLDGTPDRGGDLRLAAALEPGPPLELRLLALDGRARGIALDLARPSTVTVRPSGQVEIDGLSLGIGRGTVRADGVFDPAGVSDLTLRIDRLDLSNIGAFVPGLDLRGRVAVDGRIAGRAADPDVKLDARVAGLRFGGADLGSARVRVDYDDGRLDADLDLDGGLAEKVRLDARIPFDLDLEAGQIGPRFAGRQTIDLKVEDLRLARLQPLLGDTEAPTGRIDIDGRFSGARVPTGELTLVATDVEAMGWRVDRLELTAGYDGQRIATRLTVDSPYADTANLTARAPMRLDLQAGVAEWQRRRPHHLELHIGGVDFGALGEAVPALQPFARIPPQAPGADAVKEVVDAVPAAKAVPGAQIDLIVSGPATRPEVNLDVALTGIEQSGIEIVELDAEITVDREGVGLALSVDSPVADTIALTAAVPLDLQPLAATPIDWKPAADHSLSLQVRNLDVSAAVPVPTPPIRGRVDVDARLMGSARDPRVVAEVQGRGLAVDGRDLGRVELTAGITKAEATVDTRWIPDSDTLLTLTAAAPITIDAEDLRFEWHRERDHRLDLRFSGIDRALLDPFFALGEGVRPALTLKVDGRGHLADFEVDADLDGVVGLPTGHQAPIQGRVRLRPGEQTVTLKSPLDGADLDVDVRTEAPVPALVDGTANVEAIAYRARVDIPGLQLEPLGPLLPVALYGPEGALYLDVEGEGTLGDPELAGTVGLRDGAITLVDLSQRVEDIQLALGLSTREGLDIRELRARSGGGTLRGSGSVALVDDGGAEGRVQLEFDRWPLVRPGVPRMLLESRIVTEVDAVPKDIRVQVGINETQVRLVGQNVPAPDPIPDNPHVVFAEPPPPPEMMPPGPDDAPTDAAGDPLPVEPPGRLAIEVELVDPLEIRGSGIAMSWDGRILAVSEGDDTTVQGALRSTEGSFSLIGRDFRLTEGRVFLPEGGGMPYVEISATTTVDTYEIVASIRGKPDRPKLEFSSQPPLPDYQILTVLVTGAPEAAGGADDGESNVAREAASLLAAFQSPALEDALNEKLGIDRVGVEFGETIEEPILTVGKRVTPNLYIETAYHHNAPEDENSTEARVRYRITNRWSVETTYGDAGIGELELFWVRHFGGTAATEGVESLDPVEGEPDEPAEARAPTSGTRPGGPPAPAEAPDPPAVAPDPRAPGPGSPR